MQDGVNGRVHDSPLQTIAWYGARNRLVSTTIYPDKHLPLVYEVRFPTTMQLCQCPLQGCPGTSRSMSVLQNHFSRLHWENNILILEEQRTPLSHTERCEQQVPPWLMKNCHYNTKSCQKAQEPQRCRERLQLCFKANEVTIKVNINQLEATTSFP